MKSELIVEKPQEKYTYLKKSIYGHIVWFSAPNEGILLAAKVLVPGEVIGKFYNDWDEKLFTSFSNEDKLILQNKGTIDTCKYPILRQAEFGEKGSYIVLFSAKDIGVIVYSNYDEASVDGTEVRLPEYLYKVLSNDRRVILHNT